MQPIIAASGPDALARMDEAAIRGESFQLALLDVMMPDMDGFTLAEQIRQNPRLQNCTLIMLSSAGQPESPARCKELGIARYLIKPVKQSDLRETILRVLSAQREPGRPTELAPVQVAETRRVLHILLADDGLINQKVASELLKRRGHEVVVVNNGREAIEAVEREVFDVVLMDVQMPEMDGFEATAAIRLKEQSTGQHMQIVAMTAHALKGDRERCLEAGMDGYLTKPVQPKVLYELVERLGDSAHKDSAPVVVSAPTAAIMDWNFALLQIGGREDLLREVMAMFAKESVVLMSGLRAAIVRQDVGEVRRYAHTMKGSAAHFFAQPTVEAASRVELMGQDGDLTGVDEAYASLEHEVERLRQALTRFSKR
jgi:CheY-like chemotaxis protein